MMERSMYAALKYTRWVDVSCHTHGSMRVCRRVETPCTHHSGEQTILFYYAVECDVYTSTATHEYTHMLCVGEANILLIDLLAHAGQACWYAVQDPAQPTHSAGCEFTQAIGSSSNACLDQISARFVVCGVWCVCVCVLLCVLCVLCVCVWLCV